MGYQRRIVSSGLIFSIVNVLVGQAGVPKRGMAFLGVQNMRFKAALHPGEGLWVEGEIIEKRESQTNPDRIIVTYRWEAKKEDGTVVVYGESTEMARK